jgi:hypothetical protein
VHKLIVAVERQNQAKSAKDLQQVATLIEALAVKRPLELAAAWQSAWDAGPQWRAKLEAGRERLPAPVRDMLADVIARSRASRKRRRRD